MTPQTLKMLMMLFFTIALLNVTNYLFYWLYDPPSHRAMKITTRSAKLRKFTTRHRIIRTVRWTDLLIGKDDPNPTASSSVSEAKSASSEAAVDYREQQSSDPDRLYQDVYFNGIRKESAMCPQKPPGLGPVNIDEAVNFEAIEKLYDKIAVGGIYEETLCTARHNAAIIIPYRGQKAELLNFLFMIHPILIKQQLDYQIFAIQSPSTMPMNLGKLLNAGFTEVQRLGRIGGWRCVIFHESDLVPIDSRNLYRCSKNPHQLVASVGNRSYEFKFGGAFSIKPTHFTKVNGFSNLYSGKEIVYDDLYKRLKDANYTITRTSNTFGNYMRSKYSSGIGTNHTRFDTIQSPSSSPLNPSDGLSTVAYKIRDMQMKQMYTLIDVESLSSLNKTKIKQKTEAK